MIKDPSEELLQDAQSPDPDLSPTGTVESTMNDLSCFTQLAHATAASPEKRLQINSVDLTTLHPSLAHSEKRLHDNQVQFPDRSLSPPAPMENVTLNRDA